MRERFIYNKQDFYAAYMKGVGIFAVFIVGAAFYYFNRPYHRDELPIATAIAVGSIVFALFGIHIMAVSKEKEEIIVDTDGIRHKKGETEKLYAWQDVAGLSRVKATAAAKTPSLVIKFAGGKKLVALDAIRHESGEGGIEELSQLIARQVNAG